MSRALLEAAQAGDHERVRSQLADGAAPDWVPKAGPGRTALSEAALKGQLACVQALLEAGATVDWVDRAMGFTPLAWAADQGHLACVQALLAAGASVELASKAGLTPLMAAAGNGHLDVVGALLDAGASVHPHSRIHRNALSFARDGRHAAVEQLLLTRGAQPPTPLAEPSLPWPPYEPLDREVPEQLVRAFMLALHRWEAWAHQTQRGASTDWALVRAEAERAARPYLTDAALAGLGGSFGAPPRFGPDDALVSVTARRTQATVVVRQSPAQPVRSEVRFTLQRAPDGWRLTSVARRFLGEDRWTAFSL